MRFTAIRFLMGKLFFALGATLLAPIFYALAVGESTVRALVGTAFFVLLIAVALVYSGQKDDKMGVRESFAVVALTWIAAGVIAGFPLFFSGAVPSITDALFEGVSGLTATGATVLVDVEALPRSLLLWRSVTHWLGGMGILVFFVLLLPKVASGPSANLFRAELTGPDKSKVTPRFKEAAQILWVIYLSLTILEIIMLKWVGMPLFDAVNHAFSNVATGGFHIKNGSVGAYNSVSVESITILFMVISGANFSLYIHLWRRGVLDVVRNTELQVYLAMIFSGSLIVSASLVAQGHHGWKQALREGVFQVTAMVTTTGFTIDEYASWPGLALMTLFLLMFIGGCAGSTAGGVKVVRAVILFKMCGKHLQQMIQPQLVSNVIVKGQTVDRLMVNNVARFFVMYMGSFAVASWLLAAAGLEPFEAMGAVLASLGNVGLGFGSIAAAGNFAAVSAAGKVILTVCMLLGRLELMVLLVLLQPDFWRNRRNW